MKVSDWEVSDWEAELREYQDGWPGCKPNGHLPRLRLLPSGTRNKDERAIDEMADMLGRRDRRLNSLERRCRRLERESRRKDERIALLLDRCEKMYLAGRRPEVRERLIKELDENHPGTKFH